MARSLPSQYRWSHDYSLLLHDLIAARILAAEEHKAFDVTLPLQESDRATVAGLNGAALYAWVETKYGRAVTADMDYRAIVRGLLTDFCTFVLEGLRASARGKLTVAYALLRKPFKDNLFYLEWLLTDPSAFKSAFEEGPEAVDVTRFTPERRVKLIRNSMLQIEEVGLDADFIHELRYERSAPYGLAVPWDKASHLVTTSKQARTEPQNFNFIFSGPQAWDTQWLQLYKIVPYLLYHSVRVADALMDTIAPMEPEMYCKMTALRRDLGFIAWATSMDMQNRLPPQLLGILSADSLGEDALRCPRCSSAYRFHRRNLRSFTVKGTLRCSTCRMAVVVDGSADTGKVVE